MRLPAASALFLLAILAACSPPEEGEPGGDGAQKIPISTISREARALYLEGRALEESLRATEAHPYFLKALAEDEEFALAHLGAAQSSPTGSVFFSHLERSVELAGLASDGERHLILAFAAGVNRDPVVAREHADALVRDFPLDERAHAALAAFYFGRQDYGPAAEHYRRATDINPAFAQPYNQLGYSLRFLGDYAAAEEAFRQYIELVPSEPNPYDSYAELLMKIGRFEESIENYRRALEADRFFVASHGGISLNQILLGDSEASRRTCDVFYELARNDGERRQALTCRSRSFLFEGDFEAALGEIERRYEISQSSQDASSMALDLIQTGQILLEAGRAEAAEESFDEALMTMEGSDAPNAVKAATRRNHIYAQARAALGRGDAASAQIKAGEYGAQARLSPVPSEVWQYHELEALLASERGDFDSAQAHLEQASQLDPRTLYLLALASLGKGEEEQAKELLEKAAAWNGLHPNYAFVRAPALRLLDEMKR